MATNLGAEITEKMKLLEQIQNQLKMFHAKLTNNTNSTTTAFTQQQIQSLLTLDEQNLLQKLVMQRKTVQNEIQMLQQKLLAPSSSSSSHTNTSTNTATNATPLSSLNTSSATNILYVPTNSKPQVITATNGQLNSINSMRLVKFHECGLFFGGG